MREYMTRLVSTAIYHFKNVSYGKIDMPCAVGRDFSCDRAEILGIYGQRYIDRCGHGVENHG